MQVQPQISRRLPQGLRDAVTTIKYDFRNNWASFIDFLVHISPVSGWHDHKVYFPYLFLCLWTLKLTSMLWLGERSKSLELVWQCLHALVSNIGLICLENLYTPKKYWLDEFGWKLFRILHLIPLSRQISIFVIHICMTIDNNDIYDKK